MKTHTHTNETHKNWKLICKPNYQQSNMQQKVYRNTWSFSVGQFLVMGPTPKYGYKQCPKLVSLCQIRPNFASDNHLINYFLYFRVSVNSGTKAQTPSVVWCLD